MTVYFQLMMVKCLLMMVKYQSMMVKWVYDHILISPSMEHYPKAYYDDGFFLENPHTAGFIKRFLQRIWLYLTICVPSTFSIRKYAYWINKVMTSILWYFIMIFCREAVKPFQKVSTLQLRNIQNIIIWKTKYNNLKNKI